MGRQVAIICSSEHNTEGYDILIGRSITEWTKVDDSDWPALLEGLNALNQTRYSTGLTHHIVELPVPQASLVADLVSKGKIVADARAAMNAKQAAALAEAKKKRTDKKNKLIQQKEKEAADARAAIVEEIKNELKLHPEGLE